MWWLGARLIAERENACDESVVASGNDPQTYAEGILKVCRLYLHSPLACAAGISGADLKKRMETIMENRAALRLNAVRKLLLAGAAAAVIATPVAIGMLTAPPVYAQAAASTGPHPDRLAALRRHIEGWEKKQPAWDGMDAGLIEASKEQGPHIQKAIDSYGALKSITFKGSDGGNDAYLVKFDKATTAWFVGPLQNGKLSTLFFGPALERTDNGPSPGLEAAIQRELAGNLAGTPVYEIMEPELQNAAKQQLALMTVDAKALGAVLSISFQKVDARGWDVYHVTFANGTATVSAEPLKNGKLSGIFHSDILIPGAQPSPGTGASLRRYIESLQRGQPNYDEMTPQMAQDVRKRLDGEIGRIKPLGALKSITFKGRGGMNMDEYDVRFENGDTAWEISPLDADGKVVRRAFSIVG